MKLSDHQILFTQDVARLIGFIHGSGDHSVTLGEAYRTPEQAALNAKKGVGIKNSQHCKRLAVDINLLDNQGRLLSGSDNYAIYGDYWESLDAHNRWGGFFVSKYGGKIVDGCHFERIEGVR